MKLDRAGLFGLGAVQKLPAIEQKMLVDLVTVWGRKCENNKKRVEYYLGHNKLDSLGIAIPPHLANVLDCNVGWAAKAVDSLAVRSVFNGFNFKESDECGVNDILTENNFEQIYLQAVVSELINSCSFLTLSKGGKNEPRVLINAYSALTASAMWDMRKKRIRCGLTIVDVAEDADIDRAVPVWVNLYTDNHVWSIQRKTPEAQWEAHCLPHEMGRPLIEPLVYRQELLRPFGRSRISRPVMAIIDEAARTKARTAITAEFYSAPQRVMLGADESYFENKDTWDAYIGNIMAISRDEDGEVPQYFQLSAMSMQPHLDQMRSLAAQFAGETNIPISELGVIHDNPSSADAIQQACEPLVIEAENLNSANGEALKNLGRMIIATIKQKSFYDLSSEERFISVDWKSPARLSDSAKADAVVKWVSALPWMAQSDVPIEFLDFDNDQLERLKSDKAKAEAKAMIQETAQNQNAAAGGAQPAGDATSMYKIMSILKAVKAKSISENNAIVLFAQIGVSRDDALAMIRDADDAIETLTTTAEVTNDNNSENASGEPNGELEQLIEGDTNSSHA